LRDGLTLSDEFGGIKLSDDGFEDFVTDGRKDTFIVVLAEILRPWFSLFSYGVVYKQVLCGFDFEVQAGASGEACSATSVERSDEHT